eukprot:SAG31_NODE_2540_length_5538_cov_7.680859_2_plen_49_part_00
MIGPGTTVAWRLRLLPLAAPDAGRGTPGVRAQASAVSAADRTVGSLKY